MSEASDAGTPERPLFYLWTTRWDPIPRLGSPRSRTFLAGPDSTSGFATDPAVHPLLSPGEQERVDLRFAAAVRSMSRGLAIVLTDASTERAAELHYVYYEPCAHLVIALNPDGPQVTLHGDGPILDAVGPESSVSIKRISALLKQDRLADALVTSIDEACRILHLAAAAR